MPAEQPNNQLRMLREKDLSRQLEKGVSGKKDQKTAEAVEPGRPLPEAQEYLDRDNQLRMGLQFVKTLPKLRDIR